MPISTGVCGDLCVAAPISVAVVCGDQCDAVLISHCLLTYSVHSLRRIQRAIHPPSIVTVNKSWDDRHGHPNHCNDQHTHLDTFLGGGVWRGGKAVRVGKAVLRLSLIHI